MCVKIVVYYIGAAAYTRVYSSLPKVLIDFVRQGCHWIKSDRLYLHKLYGGLGLVHILSRLHAFRLKFIHEYSYVFQGCRCILLEE